MNFWLADVDCTRRNPNSSFFHWNTPAVHPLEKSREGSVDRTHDVLQAIEVLMGARSKRPRQTTDRRDSSPLVCRLHVEQAGNSRPFGRCLSGNAIRGG